jgi:hypothetical protein
LARDSISKRLFRLLDGYLQVRPLGQVFYAPVDVVPTDVDVVEHDVRFLIVGTYALALHGRPRATGALDVWVDATPENAARVVRALASFGAPMDQVSPSRRLGRAGSVNPWAASR